MLYWIPLPRYGSPTYSLLTGLREGPRKGMKNSVSSDIGKAATDVCYN
jgi:hypothetical protein